MEKRILIIISSLICGALFGFGLSYSDMINPQRALAFLDMTGGWDATLMFVMLGALIITMPGYYFIFKRKEPFLTNKFNVTNNSNIDIKLISGAILFGIGWGLIGLCPGPALSGLILGIKEIWIFVAAMFLGFYLPKLFKQLLLFIR